jgi:ubiquinone/menaquinone biosynthesis C-methylase UbiE
MLPDKTQLAAELFNRHAKAYQDKYRDVSLYHDGFDLFCSHIGKENPDVLELACGPGNITRYLLAKRPDLRILGIDLAPNMLELAGIACPDAEFRQMDVRMISELDQLYDGIMCGFALPYLSKEEAIAFIADASALLKERGVLYISTMEGDYSQSGFQHSSSGDQVYIHYHEAGYLTEALAAQGFHVISMQRKVAPGHEGTPHPDLVILAGK